MARSPGRPSSASASQTWTGTRLPLAVTWPIRRYSIASRVASSVATPTRICPASAASPIRRAVFTASPSTVYESLPPTNPATTSPVFKPMCMRNGMPRSRSNSAESSSSTRCMTSAARTARSASSSCACGAPNTAITSSPMILSTCPPYRSTMSVMRSNARSMIAFTSSASRASLSSVNPDRSPNSTVTTRRSSRGACVCAAPHAGQNREPSGTAFPQRMHARAPTLSATRLLPASGSFRRAACADAPSR